MEDDSYNSDLSGLLRKEEESDSAHDEDDNASTLTDNSAATIQNTPVASGLPPRHPGRVRSYQGSAGSEERRKGSYVNMQATIDENERLKKDNIWLKNSLKTIEDELPFVMIDGKDHVAEYLELSREVRHLRLKVANLEGDIPELKTKLEMVTKERDEFVAKLAMIDTDADVSQGSDWSLGTERSRIAFELEGKVSYLQFTNRQLTDEMTKVKKQLEEEVEKRRKAEEELENRIQEFDRRESVHPSAQQTFEIGADPDAGKTVERLLGQLDEQEAEIRSCRKQIDLLAGTVKILINEKRELNRQLQLLSDHQFSFDHNNVDVLLRELLDLSKENILLQEECVRLGAKRKNNRNEEANGGDDDEEDGQRLQALVQQEEIGRRIKEKIEELNKSVADRPSFLAGMKNLDLSFLPPTVVPEAPAVNDASQNQFMNASTADILNLSLNTTADLRTAKTQLHSLRDACQRMFTRLQGSAQLLDEIRSLLDGDTADELAKKIREMQLDLDQSMVEGEKAVAAFNVVERSLIHLHHAIELSVDNSSFLIAAGDESLRRATYSVHRDNGIVERDEKQTGTETSRDISKVQSEVDALRTKYEEHKKLQQEWEKERDAMEVELSNAKTKFVEEQLQCSQLKSDMDELHAQLERRRHNEDNLTAKISDLVIRERALARDLENTERELRRSREECERMEIERNEQYNLIQSLENEMKTLRLYESEYEELKIQMSSEIEAAMALEKKLRADARNAENTVVRLEGELALLLSKNKQLTSDIAAYRENMERVSTECVRLSKQSEQTRPSPLPVSPPSSSPPFRSRTFAVQTQTSLTSEKMDQWKEERIREADERKQLVEVIRNLNEETREALSSYRDDAPVSVLIEALEGVQSFVNNRNNHFLNVMGDMTEADEEIQAIVNKELHKSFSDPLRHFFFESTTTANKMVQIIKAVNEKKVTMSSIELLYQLARELRHSLNVQLSHFQHDKENDSEPAKVKLQFVILQDRVARLEEEKGRLLKRVKTIQSIITKQPNLAGVSEKITNELKKIENVLSETRSFSSSHGTHSLRNAH